MRLTASRVPWMTRVQVDRELVRGGAVVLVLEPAERHDAGVVDQHVDGSELLLDLIEELREPDPVGNVERQRDGVPADLVGGALGDVEVEIADGDRRAEP